MFTLVVDAATVCYKLRALLAVHGVPDTAVLDNGTAFCSNEFQVFMRNSQIQHVRVVSALPPLFHRTMLNSWCKRQNRRMSGGDMATKLSCFQHVLVQLTTGKSPAAMLMGRRLWTDSTRLGDKEENCHCRAWRKVRYFEYY